MDEPTMRMFERLQQSIESFKETYIDKSATIANDIKHLLNNQTDIENRISMLETWKDEKVGEDKQRERTAKTRIAKWAVVIVAIEILVAIGLKFWWE